MAERNRSFIPGALLILIGVLFLLRELDLFDLRWRQFYPLLLLGLGTLHAFPGGVPGGLVVGLVYRYVKRSDLAAFTEPLGTVVIGATISALVVAPYLGKAFTVAFWWIAFAASSIPGSIIGFVILKSLRATGITRSLGFDGEN